MTDRPKRQRRMKVCWPCTAKKCGLWFKSNCPCCTSGHSYYR